MSTKRSSSFLGMAGGSLGSDWVTGAGIVGVDPGVLAAIMPAANAIRATSIMVIPMVFRWFFTSPLALSLGMPWETNLFRSWATSEAKMVPMVPLETNCITLKTISKPI